MQFFFDTFRPITLGCGTQYDSCTAGDIAAYTSRFPGHKPFMSKADSTRELTKFLNNNRSHARTRIALDHINRVIHTPDWGPDVLVKILSDMDIAFFDGRLRVRIHVSWQDGRSMQPSGHSNLHPFIPLGTTVFNGTNNACDIRLNREKIRFGAAEPRTQMLQTLVHETVVGISGTMQCPPPEMCADEGPACLGSAPLRPPTSKTPLTATRTSSPATDGNFRWVLNLVG